jgi:hypothetical protein
MAWHGVFVQQVWDLIHVGLARCVARGGLFLFGHLSVQLLRGQAPRVWSDVTTTQIISEVDCGVG